MGEHRIKDYQFKAAGDLLYSGPNITVQREKYDPQRSGSQDRETNIHRILAEAFKCEEALHLPRLIGMAGINSDPAVYSRTDKINREAYAGSKLVRSLNQAVDPIIKSMVGEDKSSYSIEDDGKVRFSKDVWSSIDHFLQQDEKDQIFSDVTKLKASQWKYNRMCAELATEVRHAIYDMLRSYIEWTQEGSRINSRLAGRYPSFGKMLEAGAKVRKAWRGRYVTWERLANIVGMLESSADESFVHTSGSGRGIMVKPRPEYTVQLQLERLMEDEKDATDVPISTEEVPGSELGEQPGAPGQSQDTPRSGEQQ